MLKRPFHARLLDYFGCAYKSLRFTFHHLQEKKKFGNYYFPYNPLHNGDTVNILANGPSLKEEIALLSDNHIYLSESVVVNFFVESNLFLQIRPKYYCLADPGFNLKCKQTEKTENVFKELNVLVCWPMTLFVWNSAVGMVKEYISNPNITIIGLSVLKFEGFEKDRYKYYKEGKAVPSYVNVTIMAIYSMLHLGYSTINLYGVDHTFLTNL